MSRRPSLDVTSWTRIVLALSFILLVVAVTVEVTRRTTPGVLLTGALATVAMALAGIVIGRELAAQRRSQAWLRASETALKSEAERLGSVITTQQLVATADTDLDGIMRLITDRVRAITGADGVGIALLEGHDVVFRGSAGSTAPPVGLRMGLTSTVVGRCFQTGEILQSDDAASDDRVDPQTARILQVGSLIVVPLWDAGAVNGVLAATSRAPDRFSGRDVQTVQVVAGLLSAALARASAYESREAALLALQESETRYRSAVAALQEGIMLVRADGDVQPVNTSAERMLAQLPRQDGRWNLLGLPWPVVREDGSACPPEAQPPVITLCTGRAISGEVIGVPGEGQVTWLSVNCEPLWHDHEQLPHAVVASFTDITDRRRAEAALREARDELERRVEERTADLGLLNDMLERELGQRARTEEELRGVQEELETRVHERTADLILVNRSLQEAKEAAETASRTKSQFLANMSHELRTPLNSVIGFANILLKNKRRNLTPQDLTFAARIHENGRHLLGLINDILDLSKIEAGRLELTRGPVDLDALIRDTLAQIGAQIAKPAVRLSAEVPIGLAPLETDATRLKQVLFNLVGNALKFTERGSVTVIVDGDPATGRPLRIAVRDTGIGIAPERQEAIFEAFQQAENTTERRYGGTGLGLTISRSLLTAMRYRLTLESAVGQGSSFTIHLDSEEVPAFGAGALPPDPAEVGATRVLVIDDEPDAREVLRQYLEDLGCAVRTTGGETLALELAHAWQPDLITLDLRMPGRSGEAVLEALKADPALADIPVVVISVVGQERRSRLRGAAAVLDKPVSRDALRELLSVSRTATRLEG